MDYQKIKIEDRTYFIIDSIQDMRAEDSFIHNQNKLAMYSGSGEARKYVGSFTAKALSDFFDYSSWGEIDSNNERNYSPIQESTCFFSKSNLLKYMSDAQSEYFKQEQIYDKDISQYFEGRLNEIDNLTKEKIFFSIYDVSDLKNNKKKTTRAYIRSDDDIWNIWRKLILPKISYLSILKLKLADENINENKSFFYFRVFLDYQYRSIVRSADLIEDDSSLRDSDNVKKHRIGQHIFRKGVLDHMGQCPFSKITDERLLIASHIKPHKVCLKENKPDEDIDYLNGLALSPTYDYLFDQGYITFLDDGTLICGTLLTPLTWERLNINPSSKNKMRIFPDGREKYLNYHRDNIFRDNINDLLED